MEIEQLRQLLELVSQGDLSVEAAQKELAAQGPKVLPTPLASNEQKGAS